MRHSPHILVVDDDEVAVELLREALVADGYHVTVATNGNDALDLVRTSPFRLLITDLHMSGLNGLQLIEATASFRPELEIVVLTASWARGTLDEVVRLGVKWIVFKPHHQADLMALMRRILSKHEG
jgi:CheY-like chemotaxis protein